MRRIHAAMRAARIEATHLEPATPNGHDAFLVDYPLITPPVRDSSSPRCSGSATYQPAAATGSGLTTA